MHQTRLILTIARKHRFAFTFQYRYECHCGEGFDRLGQLNEASCNESCPGNITENCGGMNALNVYSGTVEWLNNELF